MTIKLKIPNMACSACVSTITKAVKTIDPNAIVEAEPKTKLVSVETQKPEVVIREVLATVGYPAA